VVLLLRIEIEFIGSYTGKAPEGGRSGDEPMIMKASGPLAIKIASTSLAQKASSRIVSRFIQEKIVDQLTKTGHQQRKMDLP